MACPDRRYLQIDKVEPAGEGAWRFLEVKLSAADAAATVLAVLP